MGPTEVKKLLKFPELKSGRIKAKLWFSTSKIKVIKIIKYSPMYHKLVLTLNKKIYVEALLCKY